MSRTVTLDGVNYTLPTSKDKDWSANLTALLLALVESAASLNTLALSLETSVNGLLGVDGAFGSIVSFGATTVRNGVADGFLWQWGGDQNTISTTDQILVVPVDGTLSKMQARLHTAAANVDAAFTVRKNAVDTALTCTISAASQTASDTTHSVAVAAGDLISLKVVTSGTPSSTLTGPRASMLFVPSAEVAA